MIRRLISEILPPINRRVIYACVVLLLGLAVNAWHKNIISSLAILITAVALAFWLGTWIRVDPSSTRNTPHS